METVHNNAEEKASIQLDMAPISEKPAQRNRASAPKERTLVFNLINLIRQAGMLVVIALLSIGSYYAISRYVLQSVEVVGISMLPTLQERNHYLLNRWTFRNREPQRNDVVVIRDPADHGFSVKRVVAVAGESIYFKNGKVYVNGRELEEPYLLPGTHTFTYAKAREEFITCGKGQYFVLGDNRPISVDSRSYGPVSRQDILGLVMLN
jgi:signal peptidase I